MSEARTGVFEGSAKDRPVLSIAIPTWNRCSELADLLQVLVPEIADALRSGVVQLLVSDNGSTDGTEALVRRHIAQAPSIEYHRHPENIGSDANFVECFERARGTYFWLFSDDDVLTPGTVRRLLEFFLTGAYDLVYATSYPFRTDFRAERGHDPLGRVAHTITDTRHMVRVVNTMLTFISGMIVNKDRLAELPGLGVSVEPPSAFLGTHMVQLSWTLPLLRRHRRSLVLWDRPVAGRVGNSGGYSIGEIFGENLLTVARRVLPDRPDLVRILISFTLRRWFPASIYAHRKAGSQTYRIEDVSRILRGVYGRNLRFWVFTYPVLKLPLAVARMWLRGSDVASKMFYVLQVPGFWRKRT